MVTFLQYFIKYIRYTNCFTVDSSFDLPKKIELIIRQVGKRTFYYLLEEKLVFVNLFIPLLLRCFDPKKVSYFYEPGDLKAEPTDSNLWTLATVSPDPIHYKEFSKRGGVDTFYMPPYEKEELLVIGAVMKKSPDFLQALKPFYEEDSINSRFNQYGGIIRRVLPSSVGRIKFDADSYQLELEKIPKNTLSAVMDAESAVDLGSYFTLLTPMKNDSKYTFTRSKVVFASDQARDDLMVAKFSKLPYDTQRLMLVEAFSQHRKNKDLAISTAEPDEDSSKENKTNSKTVKKTKNKK